MRNKYSGSCLRCKETVGAGQGHFQKLGNTWVVQHASCAIKHRGTEFGMTVAQLAMREDDKRRQWEFTVRRWRNKAKGSGKAAQRARRNLRDAGLKP